eukprot:355343-Chlamydomonas_euryale.AAC.9
MAETRASPQHCLAPATQWSLSTCEPSCSTMQPSPAAGSEPHHRLDSPLHHLHVCRAFSARNNVDPFPQQQAQPPHPPAASPA